MNIQKNFFFQYFAPFLKVISSKICIGFMPKFMYFESWASYLNKIEPIKPKY